MSKSSVYVRVEISVGFVDDLVVAGCYCHLQRMWWQAAWEGRKGAWLVCHWWRRLLLLQIIKTHLLSKVLHPESSVHQSSLIWSHPPSSSIFSSPRPRWRSWCLQQWWSVDELKRGIMSSRGEVMLLWFSWIHACCHGECQLRRSELSGGGRVGWSCLACWEKRWAIPSYYLGRN